MGKKTSFLVGFVSGFVTLMILSVIALLILGSVSI
jgi:hypothetical protein